jgi:UV DNA damage repair endonuclease
MIFEITEENGFWNTISYCENGCTVYNKYLHWRSCNSRGHKKLIQVNIYKQQVNCTSTFLVSVHFLLAHHSGFSQNKTVRLSTIHYGIKRIGTFSFILSEDHNMWLNILMINDKYRCLGHWIRKLKLGRNLITKAFIKICSDAKEMNQSSIRKLTQLDMRLCIWPDA